MVLCFYISHDGKEANVCWKQTLVVVNCQKKARLKPERTQGWQEWMSAIQVSACPTDSCLHLSLTELDCIIHEKSPLKEHLSSQSLKTNKRHTHTPPPPPFCLSIRADLSNLSTITASFWPSEHHSPLTPDRDTHTVCFPYASSHRFPSRYLSPTSLISASPAAHWRLH